MTPKTADTPVDLSGCDVEPIHIPGLIQSHGVLLALRQSDFTILQVSENVFDVLGIHSGELMHQPLSKLTDIEPVERNSKRLSERLPRLLSPIPIEIDVNGKKILFDGILHRSGRILILELEKNSGIENPSTGIGSFYESLRTVISNITSTDNIPDALDITCQEIRGLTGFSRVMVYKFDEDWHGAVVAEDKDNDLVSMLHHHFPASDIPKQARDLYTVNWLRLIPDVHYKPSPLIPRENPVTNQPLDLSNAVLRSVSPVHIEYMKNIGQGASMSVSILKGKQLWGLISCHHPGPRYLKYDIRVACEFIGQMVSTQIMSREESHEIDHRLQLKAIYEECLKPGNSTRFPSIFPQVAAKLLALVDAPGVALCLGDNCIPFGATPPSEEILKFRDWLHQKEKGIFSSESLLQSYPRQSALGERGNGALAIRIHPAEKAYLIWFRPEMKEQIPWAGNPHLQKSVSSDGKIHPRASFATWMEEVSGRSRKWKKIEIQVAEELRLSLMGLMQRESGSASNSEQINFRDSLESSMASSQASSAHREPLVTDNPRPQSAKQVVESGMMLFEGFSDFATLFVDQFGLIKSWGKGAQRMMGYKSTAVIDQSLQVFFENDLILKNRYHDMMEGAKTQGRSDSELWLYRSDRTNFWAKVMMAQVRDQSDQLLGYSIVIQDITKEKSAEEDLRVTKSAAEAANEAKTAFLANISHEIRTPLGAILGFSEIMSVKGTSDNDRSEFYQRIKRNGDQLLALINDLLDLTKVEAGRLEIEKIDFNIQDLLLDLQQTFGIKAAEKSIQFDITIAGSIPLRVSSDPTRLRQILVNLLSNALKFTSSGGKVQLHVSALNPVGNREQLVFRVIDTGRGMNEEEMSKLFQPFAQADVSTTRQFGGSGLGLFVSRRLARALHGDLVIESSRLGEGTTFMASIEVELNKKDRTHFVSMIQGSAPKAAAPSELASLAGIQVLVVDDSPDNRHLLELYLKKSGATVEMAENGQQAVEKALAGNFDIVLMDIQMPIVDGNLAMQRLLESGYKVPVVALTAHAMHEERERSLRLGFRDYLTKPIKRDVLLNAIKTLGRKEH